MVQKTLVLVVFCPDRALLDTGAALDANPRKLPDVIRADRTHGADLDAEQAIGAAVIGQRFHLSDVNRISLTVPRLVITPVGRRCTLHRNGR